MESFILKESVLNDDILMLSDKNKVFKGGFVAIVKYYKFQNSWCNSEHIKKFRNIKRLKDFLNKNYSDFDLIGEC